MMKINHSLILAIILLTGIFKSNKTILAIGCDTQNRISGDISGSCNDSSTEDFEIEFRKKYQVCIEEQLNTAIADFYNNFEVRQALGEESSDIELSLTLEKYFISDKNLKDLCNR